MKVLLDTNVLIHREARTVVRDDIGLLFNWLDRLGYEKYVHPDSRDEINRHADPDVVRTLKIKIGSYNVLQTRAPDGPEITALRESDRDENDRFDTSLLAELKAERVASIITEDRGIHRKARILGLEASVFTIDSFLEKVTAENPDLADYKVLAIRKQYFGEIDLTDPFFDSFKTDYPDFERWFNKKAEEQAYVSYQPDGTLAAFLYVKREDPGEDYSNLRPIFVPARRLKIGTLKVATNGFTIGERLLKIVFDNALRFRVEEIYVTLFQHTSDHARLVLLLQDWGFVNHGVKHSAAGSEAVFVRDFRPRADRRNPKTTFPYFSAKAQKFIVPIYPKYHTDLLPDSILWTEDSEDFIEMRRHRNALEKVYISRSLDRSLQSGDAIVFYRTRKGGPAHFTSVTTTIGIVESVQIGFKTGHEFVAACRKRSVFSDHELMEHWNFKPQSRPFIVNFLFAYSFPTRLNLGRLKKLGIISEIPRGFTRISDEAFKRLILKSKTDYNFIVD